MEHLGDPAGRCAYRVFATISQVSLSGGRAVFCYIAVQRGRKGKSLETLPGLVDWRLTNAVSPIDHLF